ncbi:hypothetical protein RBE51_21950 [Pseudomonas taiwanensis]|uniref:hypothetical protein n=1 Tax=Pseudomonas taiwanensis TaxID=470150 RepID=UPI0028DDD9BB|nr:hypothetical protein [Pseudomonas taiwanensis]MDT8925451.1 hypothetical protein [Pseudomonas taiwanensis]
MRSINTAVLSSLDLSLAELAFLAPSAKEQHAKDAVKYNYKPDPRRPFAEWLALDGPKGLKVKEYAHIQLMHALATRQKPYISVREVETKLVAEAFGTHHSSYGSISLGVPSSNQVTLVGTSTLSSHYMQFDIQFGQLSVNTGDTPHLMNNMGLIRAAMSVEQFSLLIRGGSGVKAPTKLQVIPEGLGDDPPALNPTTAKRRDFEAAIRQVAQPFIKSMQAIADILGQDLAIKANRVALGEAGKAAQLALTQVQGQISAMTVAASQEETERVQRQFEVEIAERLHSMGIENLSAIMPRLT